MQSGNVLHNIYPQHMHCKNLGGWFSPLMLTSCPVKVSSKQWTGLQMKFILWLLSQKGGVTHAIFMYYWMTLKTIHVLLTNLCMGSIFVLYANIHAILELWVHKGCNPTCGKSERWYRSCNWGNPFWVKLTFSFLQRVYTYYFTTLDSCRIDFFVHMEVYEDFLGESQNTASTCVQVRISYFASCVTENDCSLFLFISQNVTLRLQTYR